MGSPQVIIIIIVTNKRPVFLHCLCDTLCRLSRTLDVSSQCGSNAGLLSRVCHGPCISGDARSQGFSGSRAEPHALEQGSKTPSKICTPIRNPQIRCGRSSDQAQVESTMLPLAYRRAFAQTNQQQLKILRGYHSATAHSSLHQQARSAVLRQKLSSRYLALRLFVWALR